MIMKTTRSILKPLSNGVESFRHSMLSNSKQALNFLNTVKEKLTTLARKCGHQVMPSLKQCAWKAMGRSVIDDLRFRLCQILLPKSALRKPDGVSWTVCSTCSRNKQLTRNRTIKENLNDRSWVK